MERHHWYLILQLALKDFKIRYTHSALGYAWSVVNPLIFSLIYYLVFSVFIRFDTPNYPGYLLLGIVLWSFFAESTTNGIGSLLARAHIITKVALPRQVIVFAAILNALLTFTISLLVLGVLLRFTGTPTSASMLAFPILVVDLILLALGVSFLLSPLHVRYHDVGYLWGIAVQVGFWLTPVIYLEDMVPPHWTWLVRINPMARIIQQSRRAVIYGLWPEWTSVVQTTIGVVLLLVIGVLVFQRLQPRLVEHF
jgi:ABC-type polysaccharide/polyol phosphate export permease